MTRRPANADADTEVDADADTEVEVDPSLLRWIRSSAGDVSLKTMLDEVAKLETIRACDLPVGVLLDVDLKVIAEWKHIASIDVRSRPHYLAGVRRGDTPGRVGRRRGCAVA